MMARRTRTGLGKFLLIAVMLCMVAGGVWAYRSRAAASGDGVVAEAVFPVAEGPLLISVTEAGTVKPREQVIIKSSVEGRVTILSLVPEGKRVKKGDVLVELDTSNLVDKKVDQEIKVQNAVASHVQSRENLEVVKNQAKADFDKAELELRFAKEDLIKYKQGEYPNQLMDLNGRIKLAEEEAQRTKDKLEWSMQLNKEKYLSDTELKADELAKSKAELDLKLARSNLALFENYTHNRKIDELSSNSTQAEMALERVRRKASADVVQAEAQLRARESEMNRQQAKLQKISEQIVKATIRAPTDGVVVYATSTQFSWRGNVEPLEEGQEVRERQELIHLPTAKTFMAEVKIHESSLKRIYPGLPVRLTVDALPGRMFSGQVAKIAPLPDPQSVFMNPDLKIYKTVVHIDGGGDALKTGMTCKAEILVGNYENAMYVPVQCVILVKGKPTVFVRNGEGFEPREVETELDNNRMICIKSGVKPGDEVMLTPPLSAASPADPTDIGDVKIPARSKEDVHAAPSRRKGGTAGEKGGGRPSAEDMKKMRERLEKMTPEEQEAFKKKMRARYSGQQAGRGGEGQRGARGAGGGSK
ncbi:MAG: efflux RND transporter periplasmic adaptor subunit [Lentisphaeria bacterium]|nr:efflux RND transporter periplasmic adaptor subunit [Lentisphaeria bacterium]